MTKNLVAEANDLLEEERQALIAADFAALDSIAARKEALAESLRSQRLPEDALAALRRAAERNADLIAAAGRGVRAAMRRVAEIRSANGPLKTYSHDGQARTLGAAGGGFERRA